MFHHVRRGAFARRAAVLALAVASLGAIATEASAAPAPAGPAVAGVQAIDWANVTLRIPFKASSVHLSNDPDDKPCPRVTAKFSDQQFRKDGFEYTISVRMGGDVNGDGILDELVRISCSELAHDVTHYGSWYYIYTHKNGEPKLLGFLTSEHSLDGFTPVAFDVAITNKKVELFQGQDDWDVDDYVARTFKWNGKRFRVTAPLPGYPNIDTAP